MAFSGWGLEVVYYFNESDALYWEEARHSDWLVYIWMDMNDDTILF